MKIRPTLLALLAGLAIAGGAALVSTRASEQPVPSTSSDPVGAAPTATPRARPSTAASPGDTSFAGIIQTLSEPGGYFDSDNIISNEASYLHVVGALDRLDVTGGAYIGVGPDQSFSYIARIKPSIAYIIDIRRDNLLEHLLFKALFQRARNPLEYLCLLLGKPVPDAIEEWDERPISEVIGYLERSAATEKSFAAAAAVVERALPGFGVPLDENDRATIARFHRAFRDGGLGLKFSSAGRAPRPYYPTFGELITEKDLEGRQTSFLASKSAFDVVRDLQARNRVIPVVGDLAGPTALRAIGDDARRRGLAVSAFYTSNVEYYLMQDRAFDRFAANVTTLPVGERAVMIRSLFGRNYLDPAAVRGYYSSQLLQTLKSFIADVKAGGYDGYTDLVTRRPVDLRGH